MCKLQFGFVKYNEFLLDLCVIPINHVNQEKGTFESDHIGRFERGKDFSDEPVRQQEVH